MKKNKNQKTIFHILLIFVVILLVFFIYFMFIGKDNGLSTIELKEVYEFKDENQDRMDTFFVTNNGDVYLYSTYEDFDGYDELSIEEYNIKNIDSYNNNRTFKGTKLNLNNIVKVYNVEYGTGGGHYFAFLTSDNRLYFTNDYSLNLFTSSELTDIINVIDEEKCEKIDDFGNECAVLSGNCHKTCAMWAYAINSNGSKIDLYNIEKQLSE